MKERKVLYEYLSVWGASEFWYVYSFQVMAIDFHKFLLETSVSTPIKYRSFLTKLVKKPNK